MLPVAMMVSACTQPPSEGDAANTQTHTIEKVVRLTSQQVEAAHLEWLNAWLEEEDRIRPPAPSVPRPSQFSEARCSYAGGRAYRCDYSFLDGRTKRDTTANFVRNSDGSWSMSEAGGATKSARKLCSGSADKAACLLREANKTNPPDMKLCSAAQAAKQCIDDQYTAPLCPSVAMDQNGKCKIVFD